MQEPIVLASGSPRRFELLSLSGLPFEVFAPEVDERETGAPQDVVQKLAIKKARAVRGTHPGRAVLAADTLVYARGEVLGKPRDAEDALRMLRLLENGWHEVFTGVCLIDQMGEEQVGVEGTRVHFTAMPADEMERYVASGEPFDKAGAYAIQGRAGMYISSIEGSYSNVVGLPMHLVKAFLDRANIKLI